MAKKSEDVVFVIWDDYLNDATTKIAKLAVKARTKTGVTVERCKESRHRTRLVPGMFYEYYEDAVKSFAHQVDCKRSELKQMERDLAAMRKELTK